MRRSVVVGVVILAIVAGIFIGVGAYNAGYSNGLAENAQVVSGEGEVVRFVRPGWGPGFGFFPFGLILFPLFFFGIFALMRGLFWRSGWSGPGPGGPAARFEEWHRRQHESDAGATGAPPQTGSA